MTTTGDRPGDHPGDHIWARIRAELGFRPTLEPPTREPPSPEPLTREMRTEELLPVSPLRVSTETDFTARARLRPAVGGRRLTGRAHLATDDRGRRVLDVSLRGRLPDLGVRRTWLVHRDQPRRRQALGVLDGPHGIWTVDRSIDLRQFSTLHIDQHTGDNPDHTILRGKLVPS